MKETEKTGRSVVVHIAGQRYVIRSDAEEAYVKSLASFLDAQIKEIQQSTRLAATQNQVILAALNITDQLFQEQQKREQIKREVQTEAEAVVAWIDEELSRRSGAKPRP